MWSFTSSTRKSAAFTASKIYGATHRGLRFPACMNLLVETDVECPYCYEVYQTVIDTSQGSHRTIEDCTVCCRPIQLHVECEPGEVLSVQSAPG